MNLARVIAKLELGGTQLGFLRMAPALERLGIRTTVLAGEATPEAVRLFTDSGLRPEVWGGETGLQYACSDGFTDWLRPRLADADLVHGHMFGGWWAAARATPPGTPLCASEHNALQWPEQPRLAEMRAALRRVDALFAHGPATRAVVRRLGYSASRIHQGRSSIEPPSDAPQPAPGVDPLPMILFAGRLHREKGPDLLVEALPLLCHEARCVLLGVGPTEAALRRRSTELGLQGAVELPGWQERVGEWMAAADLLVVPSRYESWSQSAVTAMAHAVPVVATNVEGLPATLADRRGVLIPPEDPVALARAIDDVLAGARRPDLVGARRYAERFTAERVADYFAAVYRGLLAEEPWRAPPVLTRSEPARRAA